MRQQLWNVRVHQLAHVHDHCGEQVQHFRVSGIWNVVVVIQNQVGKSWQELTHYHVVVNRFADEGLYELQNFTSQCLHDSQWHNILVLLIVTVDETHIHGVYLVHLQKIVEYVLQVSHV